MLEKVFHRFFFYLSHVSFFSLIIHIHTTYKNIIIIFTKIPQFKPMEQVWMNVVVKIIVFVDCIKVQFFITKCDILGDKKICFPSVQHTAVLHTVSFLSISVFAELAFCWMSNPKAQCFDLNINLHPQVPISTLVYHSTSLSLVLYNLSTFLPT